MIALVIFASLLHAELPTESYTEAPPAVLWIEQCGAEARLSVVRDWERAGFKPMPAPNSMYEIWAAELRAQVEKLSLELAPRLLPAKQGDLQYGLEFSEDGHADASAPAPEGCSKRAFAMDMRRVREGVNIALSRQDLDALPPLDRQVALLLLKGVRANIVRTLFDENSLKWSDEERIERFRALKIPASRLGTFDVATDSGQIVKRDGRIVSAPAVAYPNSRYTATVYFAPEGYVYQVHGDYTSPVVLKQVPGGRLFGGPWACLRALYRPDGSLALCDNTYFDWQGLLVAQMPTLVEGAWDMWRVTGYDRKPARHAIMANTTLEPAVVGVQKNVESALLLVGEPSCEGVTSKTTNDRLEVTLPRGCVGVFRLTYAP